MAEGGRRLFTASSNKYSDEVFDFSCTPCAQDGHFVEAFVFCADCVEFFCPPCKNQHKRFGGTSGHTVVNADQADQETSLLPTERCSEHAGERISTFCAEHDVVVCSTCLALNHRACKGSCYIPSIAGSKEQSKDRKQIMVDISESLKAMGKVKVSIQDRQANVDTEKKVHIQRINGITENIIKHAKTLQKAAGADIDDHHKKSTDGLQYQAKAVDDVTAKMKDRLKKLSNTQTTIDSQTFVDIKQGRKEVQAAKQLADSVIPSSLGQGKTTFAVADPVHIFLNDADTLGNVVRINTYKAILEGRYDVRLSENDKVCQILDMHELSNGNILITDFENQCIKLLDKSNKVSKSFKLQSWPWGICQISKNEVVVTLMDDKKVQFVNVKGHWKLVRSFNVEDTCRHIAHCTDQLLISCGGYMGDEKILPEGPGFVGIYDMSGTIIRKIQFDLHGRQIFSTPLHIATTNDGRNIHIADKKGGVLTIDRRGNVLARFADNIQWAIGVCALSDDSLIACGLVSNNVLQIDTSGNLVAELAGQADALVKPLSVTLAQNSSKMFLSFTNSIEIIKYDIYPE